MQLQVIQAVSASLFVESN